MVEPMEDSMDGLENPPLQPPQPSPNTAPLSRASTPTLDGHSPSLPGPQLQNQSDTTPAPPPTALPGLSPPGPANITLPTLEPNPFSLFMANDSAPANNQSPFLAAAQRIFPQTTRLSEAGQRASIRANLGRAFDFAAPPRPNRAIQRVYFENPPAPPPRPTNDSPSGPSNPPATATEPPPAAASPSSTTDSETSQQEREQRRQQRRLERREWRRDDRQRQRQIRRERHIVRRLENDLQQRSRWQRRAANAHPNSPTRQALIVRNREVIRDERRAVRNTERSADADGGPPAAFDLRFFGGRPPNMGEANIAQERARTDEAHAEAMAQEEMERLAAAGHPDAIASAQRRAAAAAAAAAATNPPVGFNPHPLDAMFEHIARAHFTEGTPAFEVLNGPTRRRAEVIQDRARQTAELAQLAARDAFMAERARAMGVGPQFERAGRERREKAEREKEEATREMEELVERMSAEKRRQERERWEGRGGGALERLKIRLGESFGVLEGEVVLAHHVHEHRTDPPEALLKSTRAAGRANAHAANKAANAISVPPITITAAERKEVQSATRNLALAREKARILSAIRPGGDATRGGITVGIRQETMGGRRVIIHETTEVRTVPVGEQMMDVPGIFMDGTTTDAEDISGEIQRRTAEMDAMMARLERQRAEVRRGRAELAMMQEEAGMEGVEPERDQAVDEAVEEMESRAAELRRQGVEIQRRRAEVDGRRLLERRREELERMWREQATEQGARGWGELAGAAERMVGELRLALFEGVPGAAADAGGGVVEGGQLEGARLEEAWRRLAAQNVEVIGEVVYLSRVAEDEIRRAEERRRAELERMWREQVTGQGAGGWGELAAAAERMGGGLRLTLFEGVPGAVGGAGGGVEGAQLERARLEEAWRRLAAGNVEVLGEVVHVSMEDEMQRAEAPTMVPDESVAPWDHRRSEIMGALGGGDRERSQAIIGEWTARRERERRERVRTEQEAVMAVVQVGEGEAVLGGRAEMVEGEEALMAREMERRAARESPGAEIDRLVGMMPEDEGGRYQEALEMAQILLRGDLGDGDQQ